MSDLSDAEARRIYADAFQRAMPHAVRHVPRDEAREIAHHVAGAAVSRHAGRPDGDRTLDAFVRRAVVNRLRDHWRSGRRRAEVEGNYEEARQAAAPAWTRPDAELDSAELDRVIQSTVDAMPEAMRRIFLLVRRDECSYKDVAERLGIGVGTVHAQLSRANQRLRHAVAAYRAERAAPPGNAPPRAAETHP